MRKRIIALLLIFVTLISVMIVPVSATPGDAVDYLVDNFWNMIRGKDSDVGVSQAFPFLDALLSPGKTPETATESDWKNAYNQYNTTINTTYGTTQFCANGYIIPLTFRGVTYPSWGIISTKFTTNTDAFAFDHGVDGAVVFSSIPSIGKVTLIEEAYVSPSYGTSVQSVGSGLYYSIPGVSGSDLHLNPGFPISVRPGGTVKILTSGRVYLSSGVVGDFSCQLRFALYYVPDVLPDIVTNIDTRTGSLSGNFGYYGDNGQLIAAENMTIVNETNNTYTNPQTGTTSPVTNWTYDYSDRSYKLTLESGDTVNVTYGDENVTIKEGDTVYNIYYLTTGGGETPDPGPGGGDGNNSNNHDNQGSWFGNIVISIGDIFNNVLGGGSGSGEDNPDSGGGGIISGLFGKIGELIGAFVNGILKLIETAIMKLLDGVIAIINMLSEKLGQVLESLFAIFDNVPKMFDGFTLFLTHCFAFLPPEIMTFLTFGVLAMVLIAIFRFFLGK